MNTYTTTIALNGITYEVEYDYQAREEPIYRINNDGEGDPGCDERIEIISLTYNGENFSNLIDGHIDEIEGLIKNNL